MKWIARVVQVVCLALGVCVATHADDDVSGSWQTVLSGALPDNALPLTRDDAGQDEYLCRAFAAGGQHLGRTSKADALCHVAVGGTEQTLDAFDVLITATATPAAPPPSDLGARLRGARIRATTISQGGLGRAAAQRVDASEIATQDGAASRVTPAHRRSEILSQSIATESAVSAGQGGSPPHFMFCPTEATAPARADEVVSAGFDADAGEPFIDKTAPDGSAWRKLKRGGFVHLQPGQNPTHCSLPSIRISAQPPLPPELPQEGTPGRKWIEYHNDSLLGLISDLVHRDPTALTGIKQAEQRYAGDNLFKQIEYRTGIANFYAGQGR